MWLFIEGEHACMCVWMHLYVSQEIKHNEEGEYICNYVCLCMHSCVSVSVCAFMRS